MADGLTITVDTAALFTALDQLGAEAEGVVKAAALVTAQRVRAAAFQLIPKATGETARALTVEDGDKPLGGYRVFVAKTSHPDDLAFWLEFGTVKMPARPFMRPAEAQEQTPHMERIGEALQRAIAQRGFV